MAASMRQAAFVAAVFAVVFAPGALVRSAADALPADRERDSFLNVVRHPARGAAEQDSPSV
jgi:hypothetical protein